MIIEMAGAPGAGKTTVRTRVVPALQSMRLEADLLEDAIRPLVGATGLGRIVRALSPPFMRRGLEWRLYSSIRLLRGVGVLVARPRLWGLLTSSQWRRPEAAHARKRRVAHWWLRAAGAGQIARARAPQDHIIVVDEGLVHRTVQLFTSPDERADPIALDRYISEIPHPDVVVLVEAPMEVCFTRAIDRGIPDHWAWKTDDEIRSYVQNAHEAVQLTVQALARQGVPIVVVNNADGKNEDWIEDLRRVVLIEPERAQR